MYVVLEPSAKTTERVYDSPADAAVEDDGQVTVPELAVLPGEIVVVTVSAHEVPPYDKVADVAVVVEVPELTK